MLSIPDDEVKMVTRESIDALVGTEGVMHGPAARCGGLVALNGHGNVQDLLEAGTTGHYETGIIRTELTSTPTPWARSYRPGPLS